MKKQYTLLSISSKIMNDIIQACSKINRTQFPSSIDGVEYKSLTDYVHKITRKFFSPFSAKYTEKTKKNYIYECTFSKNGCFSKLVFSHFIDFYENQYFTFNTQDCNFQHCNHPLNEHFVESHRNCCSDEIVEQVKFQTKLGVLPGRIRSNLDIEVGSNHFYEMRRPILEEERQEDLDSLIQMMQKGNKKKIKVRRNNDILESITILDNEIMKSDYSSDIAVIDDTAMTNMYGLPLEAIVVVDQEKHTQLLGYSIIKNKSSESFSTFFSDYIELGGPQFRIIVVDRLEAQFDSISKIFPNSFVVFCLVHIRRDLVQHFGADDEIVTRFDSLRRNPFQSYEYLDYLKKRRLQLISFQGLRCLGLLLARHEHWLPICLIKKGFYLSFDTSRIEGLFGLFKGNYGHNRGQITTVIKNLNNLCGLLKTNSYSTYLRTFRTYSQFPLVKSEDIKILGKMILDFLKTELEACNLINFNAPCVWCELRRNNSPYAIPCRHVIRQGFVIDTNQIHKRFLRNPYDIDNMPNLVVIEDSSIQMAKNRTNFLTRIDPFVNLYGKNKDIDSILDTAIDRLESLRIVPNKGMPPTIAQSGRAFVSPSKNVCSGRQKTKRNYNIKNPKTKKKNEELS